MDVTVRSAVGRYDDFFEVVGVKKPGGQGCWCMSYRDSRVAGPDRPAYMRGECERAPGPGVLAYVDGTAAGWCSVAPRSTYRRLLRSRTIPFVDDRDPFSIVCFVVVPRYRRQGLMHHLLAGAVEHARESGADVVEGYPADVDSRIDVISGYVGTVRLFEEAGFRTAAGTTAHSGGAIRTLMRLELTGNELVRPR